MASIDKSTIEKKVEQADNSSVEHLEDSKDDIDYIAEELTELSAIEDTAASKAAWLITTSVSLGGFLFGYDTGYISAVLVTIGTSLGHDLSSGEEEMVTSLTSGGALVGAVGAGLMADRYGRKLPIWFACVIFVIGSVLQAAAFSISQFALGRFIVGLGVGLAAMVVPLYIGELAPAKFRGRMIAFNNTSVTFGQLVASSIGAGLAHVQGPGWRGTVAIGAIPAIALAILLLFCPESPRQLVSHGKIEEAGKVLQRIYPASTNTQREAKVKAIQVSLHEVASSLSQEPVWFSFKRIFKTPPTGRAVFVACVVMAISQFSGFNTLMYYAATLFSIVGFKNSTAVGIVVSGTNFLFSIANILLVDRVGRRRLMTVTILAMSICLLMVAIAFHFIPIDLQTLKLEADSVGWAGTLVLVCIILFVIFYTTGVATIAWIGTELIPLEARALGTMLITVSCWGSNIVVASTFLSMMKGITPSGAFGFYSAICFVGWLFVVSLYPDVKGMPLESIREVFQHGFGVRFSKQWQREHKGMRKMNSQTFGH